MLFPLSAEYHFLGHENAENFSLGEGGQQYLVRGLGINFASLGNCNALHILHQMLRLQSMSM